MSPDVLFDSDVILKLCIYGFEPWKLGRLLGNRRISTVGASKYIIPKRISRSRSNRTRDEVRAIFASFQMVAEFLEPDEDEVSLAAEMEILAQRNGLAFDIGESLLIAIMASRNGSMLITGDKRAVFALSHLCSLHGSAARSVGRVACLEQLAAGLIAHEGGAAIRAGVCNEPGTDAALSICFRCASSPATDAVYLEGLNSYLGDLRKHSGQILCSEILTSVAEDSLSRSAEKDGEGIC